VKRENWPPRAWSLYVIQAVWRKPGCAVPRISYYTGITCDVSRRLAQHNAGACRTTRGKKWNLHAMVCNLTVREARELEKWMKRGDTTYKRKVLREWYVDPVNVIPCGVNFMTDIGLRHQLALDRVQKDATPEE